MGGRRTEELVESRDVGGDGEVLVYEDLIGRSGG